MPIITLPAYEHDDDDLWSMLYIRLKPLVCRLVYDSHLSRWEDEEEATAEDIVSDTIEHILRRVIAGSNGQAEPVLSIWGVARKTAFHIFIDLVRKQGREVLLSRFTDETNEPLLPHDSDTMETAIQEALDNEQLFNLAAQEIKEFPDKQRDAMLKDHARLTDFEQDTSPLQYAYHEAGIQLENYRTTLPMDEAERRRHASLLYHAYQRLAHLPSVQAYISIP
ncbi:MAG TPA: hypothetical protein VNE38_15930 [Ktedonobacteraceae bacterium]|nr:hypothetical protein [Ktedonobacteraceae bacterium]